MLAAAVKFAKSLGVDTRAAYHGMSRASLDAAIKEQKLDLLRDRLREIVPDLSQQYTGGQDAEEYRRYWETKLRSLHAFQVHGILEALDAIGGGPLDIVDIGDSSGNHGKYVKTLSGDSRVAGFTSVNVDPAAVEKIKRQGGDAYLAKAEEFDYSAVPADLYLCLETLEHLTDPTRFLHKLAEEGVADHLLITVPYRRQSRFGGSLLDHIGTDPATALPPESTHIFELSPTDWRRLARFAGYRTVFERIYLQYPRRGLMRVTAPVWRKLDFEGFLMLLLARDLRVAKRYTGW